MVFLKYNMQQHVSSEVFPEFAPKEQVLPRDGRDKPKLKDNQFSRLVPELTAEVQSTTLCFSNLHQYGQLYVNYLRARREVFIDHKGWELPQTDGMEFDQYDTPQSRWVVIHEYGRVLAGMRLTPTTAKCGAYSYMLRDAQLGLLENIPRDVLFLEAPERPDVWEATRLFVAQSVSSKRRIIIQTILLEQMAASANALGARSVIGIVPAVFSRWMKRIGMNATPIGRAMCIEKDRIQAALMNVSDPKSNL